MEKTSDKLLQIDLRDNVLVALKPLEKGTSITWLGESFNLVDDIPAKHKFFIQDIPAGEKAIMYGVTVGILQHQVIKGNRMTVDNTKHATDSFDYRNVAFRWQIPDVSKYSHSTFNGYYRKDGRVGTANYWLFIPTVFCENRNMDVIKEALQNELGYAVTDAYKAYTHQLVEAFKNGEDINSFNLSSDNVTKKTDRLFNNIDGIKFLNHQGGCGGTRQDAETLGKLLAAYADHPNVAGITLLSLGCQHLQVTNFLNDLKQRNPSFEKPLIIFEQQQSESESVLIKDAIRQTFQQLIEANKAGRHPAPLSKLCVGVKCGGSDGFSGISANPAVGHCADLLVALGGTVLLAEFP